LTAEGELRGTLHYMSPEQLRRQPIDARSDLFSIGVVLHEMLVGRLPFVARTPADLISSILRDEPQSVGSCCPETPESLGRLIQACLEKDVERRIQTACDLLERLDDVRREATAVKTVHSIAVLPFADMSAGKDQEHFCQGIAEEIINALTKIEGLRVASRTSAFRLVDSDLDSREIGRRLGVTTLLEGSVRMTGEKLRVTAQLVDSSDDRQLWSERYDREMRDIFDIQDDIARRIAEALEVALTPTEQKALHKPKAREVKAYEYYLRGRRYFYLLTRKNLGFAREMFERAIEIDPDYAMAYCGLADCFSFLHTWYEQRAEYLEGAERASERGVALSPDLAEAHASRGLAASLGNRSDDRAERHFETALRLNPRLFEAYYFFARDCFANGRLEKAARLFERAAEVRPEDYQAALLLPQVYKALGRQDEAERATRRALEISERHLQLHPDDVRALCLSPTRWIEAGDTERGLGLMRRALELEPTEPAVLTNAACVFAVAGLTDDALDMLEKAVEYGFGHRKWIDQDPDLDAIRDHPRFKALMERLS